ncbi:hypothetical protein [uncultured Psychroserpens sp.]|uniref:hypothetical protein n=1 Tax=uncultured Psychroserpens sp. TaxID=255436 RepID=UPI00262597F3|nr:hypothetical protein [uncultured Psychroserpens sp.]
MIISFSCTNIMENYSFSLIQNSLDCYTITAVSEFGSESVQPAIDSYGFILILPDFFSISVNEVFPVGRTEPICAVSGDILSSIDTTKLSDKFLFFVNVNVLGNTINAQSRDAAIPLMTITVNGSLSKGEIKILDNNSALVSSPFFEEAIDAFFQVNITDNRKCEFYR